MYKFNALINNEYIKTEQQLEILNPVDQKVIGTVSSLTKEHIDNAFMAASNAQKSWENLTIDQRISYLEKWKELMREQQNQLAEIMMAEIAKGFKDSLTEVLRTIEYIEETIIEAKKMKPLIFDEQRYQKMGKKGIFTRVAKGVGVAISPFNYPINLAVSKIAPALVMGNTVVFKPATQGSLIGSMLGQLAKESGFPKGVFNVVTGRGREIGDVIVTNKNIDFISFTGSVSVGKHLLEIASSKDVVLELGGKDPALVLDDLDLNKYAKEIITGAYSYSGQRCTAIKRVITTSKIADQLVPLLKDLIANLSIGLPIDDSFITPVIDMQTADYVMGLVKDAKDKGAKIVIGDKCEKNLIWPTLIDNVTVDMKVAWEEPFGPILPIIRIDNIDEMIQIANHSNFGLQASVYCQDLDLALKVGNQIETGTVNINGKSQRGPDTFPFIGIKDSGFGVQGITETLNSVTRYKGIVINK